MEGKSQQRLRYFECTIENELHDGELLNLICVEKSCKSAGLICSICRLESHADHAVFPLKVFLRQISPESALTTATTEGNTTTPSVQKNDDSHQQPVNVDEVLSQLNSSNAGVLSQLRGVIDSLTATVKHLEVEYELAAKKISEKITAQVAMSENLPKVIASIRQNEYSDVEELKAKCKELVNSTQCTVKNTLQTNFNPQDTINRFTKIQDEIVRATSNAVSVFENSMKSLEGVIQELPVSSAAMPFSFQTCALSPTIKIEGNLATQTQSSSNSENRLVLGYPALSLKAKTRFVFRVRKLKNWLALGIGLKRVIEQNRYLWVSGGNHGTFMVSSNGYSWSTYDKSENSQRNGFEFRTHDVIIVEFEPEEKLLRFYNEGGRAQTVMNVDFEQGDEIYPCVNFCEVGESVQLLTDYLKADERNHSKKSLNY